MDPDKCLDEIIELCDAIESDLDKPTSPLISEHIMQLQSIADDASQLCEHVKALDEWIKKGGFLPASWSRKP